MHDRYDTIPTMRRRYEREIERLTQQLERTRGDLALLDKEFVQVRLGHLGRLYCYRVDQRGSTPKIGDWVRVSLPSGKPHYTTVKAYGRGDYTGDVYKTAILVEVV